MSDEIVEFTVIGQDAAYLTDDVDADADLDVQHISSLLTFVPSIREALAVSMNPPRTLRLEPVLGRFEEDGQLHSIDGHVGVRLIANCAALNLPLNYELTYTCTYTHAVYGDQKSMPIASFVLAAPTEDITIDITDPEWRRLPDGVQPLQPTDAAVVTDLLARINAKYSLPPGGVPLNDTGFAAALNAKYTLPGTGIPKTDLATGVQASLTSADTALQGTDPRLSDTRTPGDGTVTTAKIADANVTLSKLSAPVQTSLTKADTALQTATADTLTDATVVGKAVVRAADAAAARMAIDTLSGAQSTGRAIAFAIALS